MHCTISSHINCSVGGQDALSESLSLLAEDDDDGDAEAIAEVCSDDAGVDEAGAELGCSTGDDAGDDDDPPDAVVDEADEDDRPYVCSAAVEEDEDDSDRLANARARR